MQNDVTYFREIVVLPEDYNRTGKENLEDHLEKKIIRKTEDWLEGELDKGDQYYAMHDIEVIEKNDRSFLVGHAFVTARTLDEEELEDAIDKGPEIIIPNE